MPMGGPAPMGGPSGGATATDLRAASEGGAAALAAKAPAVGVQGKTAQLMSSLGDGLRALNLPDGIMPFRDGSEFTARAVRRCRLTSG